MSEHPGDVESIFGFRGISEKLPAIRQVDPHLGE